MFAKLCGAWFPCLTGVSGTVLLCSICGECYTQGDGNWRNLVKFTIMILLIFVGNFALANGLQQHSASEDDGSVTLSSGPILFARDSTPWAVKINSPGFVRAEDVRSEICELYDYRVVIQRRYGKIRTGEVIHLDTRGSYSQLSNQAFGEKVIEGGITPCDIPATTVKVNRWVPDSGPESFIIYSSGGCGSTPMRREGPASRTFMDILDQYCPNTVSFFSAD